MTRHTTRTPDSRLSLILLAAISTCLLYPAEGFAATKQERQQKAAALVSKALLKEASGVLDTERRRLLEAALVEVPEYQPAMWHSGKLRFYNDWVDAQQVPELIASDPRYKAYFNVREDYQDTVEDQIKLAQWCNRHGLEAQERAHYTRVLALEPDHLEVRRRLGFRRVDGVWLSQQEMEESNERAIELREQLAKWRPECLRILKKLQSRSLQRQEVGVEDLLAIGEEEAIPALELVFALQNEAISKLLIRTLDGIQGRDAALALARQAVYSPWESVRTEAAYTLRGRRMEAYVPALLSSLYTPVQSKAELYRAPGGRLLYTHVFYREGRQHKELAVMQTLYQRIAVEGGDGVATLNRALHMMNDQYQQREQAAARQNALTDRLNDRIHEVLSTTSSQILPEDPAIWWDWWSAHNEVFTESEKPTDERISQEKVTLVDSSPGSTGSPGETGGSSPPPSLPMDCLARGTLIWTARGTRPIEEIEVGDMVLAQDSESGEIAYKPVLRSTRRPPSKLVRIHIDGQTIITSGGHLFWRAGRGWTKARELAEGMILHRQNGSARVDSVVRDGFDETFNVVVADFHSYFIGEQQILSHDNTIREPSDAIVPGLIDAREEALFE